MVVIGYVLCVIIGLFGIAAFLFACEQQREWRKAEKQIEAEEKKVNETLTEASNTKSEARTGDHKRDIDFMADVLHDYATKK